MREYRQGPALAGFILLGLVPAITQTAQAEDQLPTVKVTAQAPLSTTPDAATAQAALEQVAGGVSLVEAQSYREGRVSTPADALRYAPGVFVASRFGAEESRLSIRGSGLQRTFHGRGIMFLQDGVPLNLADGGGDFQAMEPLASQYIEVYRGANALQYGSGTLGGAINFISPTGRTAQSGLRAEAGSFDYQRLQGQLVSAGENSDFFLSLSNFSQDGFRDHAEQQTQRLFANAGWQPADHLEHRFFFSFVNTDSELPGSLTEQEFKRGELRKAAPSSVSGDQKRDFTLWRLSHKTAWSPVDSQLLELATFFSHKDLFHPIFQVLEQNSTDYGLGLRWQQQGVFGREGDSWVLGSRYARGTTDDDRFVNAGGQPQARTDASRQRADNVVAFTEYRLGLPAAWELIGGLQWLSAQREFADRFVPGNEANKSFSVRYEKTLPRLGLLKTMAGGWQLFANVSELYEPPSFGELSGGPGVSQLKAQEGRSYELGSRGQLGQAAAWQWDVALYQADLKHELLGLNGANGATATVNADKTRHRGVEAGLNIKPAGWWSMRLAYQFNDFRFENDARYGRNHIAGVPEQVLNAELMLRPGAGFYLGPTLSAANESYVDHVNKVSAPGYAVYGLKLGQQFNTSLSWFLEGRNLGDKRYAATTGVVRDASELQFGQAQRLFNPGDGRAVYAGLSWQLQ